MKALVMDLVLFGALFAWCAGSGQVTVRRAAGALAASGVCLVSAWLVGLYGGNTLAQVFFSTDRRSMAALAHCGAIAGPFSHCCAVCTC